MRGTETEKAHKHRLASGFYEKYMAGNGLDIGFAGYVGNPEPVLPNAIGIDIGYPGYDGKILPFDSDSQDFVFASHVLEHIEDYQSAIREWYRVLRVNGFLIIAVPHQWLYEKEPYPPSFFCSDHKRFYTPASLFLEIESALDHNSYRIVHFRDCDEGFCYQRPPRIPMNWCDERFEMECVLKKIAVPHWMPK